MLSDYMKTILSGMQAWTRGFIDGKVREIGEQIDRSVQELRRSLASVKQDTNNLDNKVVALGDELRAQKCVRYDTQELSAAQRSQARANIEAMSSTSPVLRYTSQTLTDVQKTQARANIGAGTSNFSGAYSALTGKPSAVLYTAQSLAPDQKAQARVNIGAMSGDIAAVRYDTDQALTVEAKQRARKNIGATDYTYSISKIKLDLYRDVVPLANYPNVAQLDLLKITGINTYVGCADGDHFIAICGAIVNSSGNQVAYFDRFNPYSTLGVQISGNIPTAGQWCRFVAADRNHIRLATDDETDAHQYYVAGVNEANSMVYILG